MAQSEYAGDVSTRFERARPHSSLRTRQGPRRRPVAETVATRRTSRVAGAGSAGDRSVGMSDDAADAGRRHASQNYTGAFMAAKPASVRRYDRSEPTPRFSIQPSSSNFAVTLGLSGNLMARIHPCDRRSWRYCRLLLFIMTKAESPILKSFCKSAAHQVSGARSNSSCIACPTAIAAL
jgi:hypothetical protein